MTNNLCAVVISLYKEDMNPYEYLSLNRCFLVIGHKYDIYFVTYDELDISRYTEVANRYGVEVKLAYLHKRFFDGIEGYNNLMTNINLYKFFSDYEYMFVYHLDCYIFKDDLEEWARKSYNAIECVTMVDSFYTYDDGTPNFDRYASTHVLYNGEGLRHVLTFIDFLSNNIYDGSVNEDIWYTTNLHNNIVNTELLKFGYTITLNHNHHKTYCLPTLMHHYDEWDEFDKYIGDIHNVEYIILNPKKVLIDLCCVGNYYLEGKYAEEFCRYYIEKVNVNIIHLYDDIRECSQRLDSIPYIKQLIEYGRIHYIPMYERKPQQLIYEDFYYEYKNTFDWCCFFDMDEFIVFPKHDDIIEYLNDRLYPFYKDECLVIQVLWALCGDNDYLEYPANESVLETFGKDFFFNCNISTTKVIVKGHIDGHLDTQIGHMFCFDDNVNGIYYADGNVVGYKVDRMFDMDMENCYLIHCQTKSTRLFIDRKKMLRLDFQDRDKVCCKPYYYEVYYSCSKWTEQKEIMFTEYYES